MLIKGNGVDLVEVARIAKALQRDKFRHRVYTPGELAFLEKKGAPSWAARFAAKEAAMKALGRGFGQGVSFQEIEISTDKWGRPQVQLRGETLKLAQKLGVSDLLVSLSHTKELAIAYVIALGKE